MNNRRRAAEVFPWMEHSAAACAIVTAVLAYSFGWGTSGLILGAIAGALSGAWIALHWASVPNLSGADLWDAWIDETRETEVWEIQMSEVVDCEMEIVHGRARVRPRFLSLESGESLPLEDRIGQIFAEHERGAICIFGPDGSGKSTALAHLARLVPPHLGVTFLDRPDPSALVVASTQGRVVYASALGSGPKPLAYLILARWGQDEWIEYLLAGDRSLCAPVMARLSPRKKEQDLLEGMPELWAIVLDRMSADESIEGPRQALRTEFDRCFSDPDYRMLIEGDCLRALGLHGNSPPRRLERLRHHNPDMTLFRLIRHRPIQLLLAADRLTNDLAEGKECKALLHPIPRDLVREAALQIARRPEAIDRLQQILVASDQTDGHPMAASLLHATGIGWKPGKPTPCLQGAYLEEAAWAGIVLVEAALREVDLRRSDLWGSRLDSSQLEKAQLSSADLRTASLCQAWLRSADLRRARLGKARAEGANFESALLESADFEAAFLDDAIFKGADLTGVCFAEASLVGADLTRAKIERANFTGANLRGAILRELKLAGARFEGAGFTNADLSKSNLEEMVLPGAEFAGANFSEALLTGSGMPGANFRKAKFRNAGLANVEWERADLRDADFRGAAFHLGSSRSGLVDSVIASEGTRTGFYTDDFNDQDFKSPEEIRKANLRGADLRGANIKGVDFYLVDLRDAKLDPEQVDHLRSCGAILESRA